MFDPSKQSLADFLQELNDTAEKAFGNKCKEWFDDLLYAKMPPHLKKSINRAQLEDAPYEKIVKHLRREMELNGLESDELPITTISTVKETPKPKKRVVT